jgi:hypothetical protein
MMPYTVTRVRDGKVVHPIQSTPRQPKPAVIKPPPKTYYAKRLLEHGALTHREFVEITGWASGAASRVLEQLRMTKIAERQGNVWQLTA